MRGSPEQETEKPRTSTHPPLRTAAGKALGPGPNRVRVPGLGGDNPGEASYAAFLTQPERKGKGAPIPVFNGEDHACGSLDLTDAEDVAPVAALRRARSTGRPAGAADWLEALERDLGRTLLPSKRGPKPKIVASDQEGLFSAVSP